MLALSLVAGCIHACLSGLLIMPASQVSMILIAGWALSLCNNGRQWPQKSATARLVLLSGLIVSLAVVVFAGREITQLPERTVYAEQYGPTVPRFWQNGRICEYTYAEEGPGL